MTYELAPEWVHIQFAEDSLRRYQNLVDKDPENPPPTLFTKLFRGEEDEALTMKEIRDEAMIYILAGSDTTALTLTYLVWAVCRDGAIRKTKPARVGAARPSAVRGRSRGGQLLGGRRPQRAVFQDVGVVSERQGVIVMGGQQGRDPPLVGDRAQERQDLSTAS